MKLSSTTLMSVVQLSLMIQTRQRQCWGLRHPRRMISPFNVTSQPVALKNTLQLASHRTATDRRLLVRPGRLWAIQAFGGNLRRRRSTTWVVCIFVAARLDDGDGFGAGGGRCLRQRCDEMFGGCRINKCGGRQVRRVCTAKLVREQVCYDIMSFIYVQLIHWCKPSGWYPTFVGFAATFCV